MFLAWPLILLLIIPLGVGIYYRKKHPLRKKPLNLAESKTLPRLPSYKKLSKRLKKLTRIEAVLVILIMLTLVLLISRPQAEVNKIEEEKSRDIVFCSDSSGSMTEYIPNSLRTMKEIVGANPKDKYAITLFQNVAYTALPLTRDVTSINIVIDELIAGYESDTYTEVQGYGYSSGAGGGGTDIGAGLAGCVKRFPNLEEEKSRHVILLSDMDHNGVINPDVVATLFPKYGINLYLMVPELYVEEAKKTSVVSITNAPVFTIGYGQDVGPLVSEIFRTIQNTNNAEEVVLADNPYPFWVALLIFTLALSYVAKLKENSK